MLLDLETAFDGLQIQQNSLKPVYSIPEHLTLLLLYRLHCFIELKKPQKGCGCLVSTAYLLQKVLHV